MIQLRILGSTDLRGHDGQALLSILSQPKRFTLLAYLTLKATEGFTRRDKLLSLFWPESDTNKARASLRRSLSYLRKSLGEGILVTRGDEEVGIAAGVLECDALQFDAALERDDAEAAWALYGGALLDGVHVAGASDLERWLEDERGRLERQAVEAASILADRSEEEGSLDAAIAWTREARVLEPLSEFWIGRLIGLLGRVGDREGADRAYDAFVGRLQQDLGVEPSVETQTLIEAVRSAPLPRSNGVRDRRETTDVINERRAPTARIATQRRSYPRLLKVATISLAVVTIVAVLRGSRRTEPEPVVLRHSIVMAEGEEMPSLAGRRFAISPDGSRFVYTGGPERRLWVRQRDQLHGRSLPDTERSFSPFFSPDGERVGFFSDGELKIASLGGGAITPVTASVDPFGGGTWGPVGFLYAESEGFGGLVRVRAEAGASPQPFTNVDYDKGETEHQWPDALPDGAGILFTVALGRMGSVGSEFWIAVADTETGTHKALIEGIFARHAGPGHLIYVTPDSTLMVVPFDSRTLEVTGSPTLVSQMKWVGFRRSVDVSVSETGTLMYAAGDKRVSRELAWVTRDGIATPIDTAWRGDFGFPALSPDGSRVAVTLGSANGTDVWIRDLDNRTQQKLTVEGGVNGYPSWTPDGRSVTYFSLMSGRSELWTKPADGSLQSVLQLSRPRDLAESLWSPDGRWLIFRTTNLPKSSTSPSGTRVAGGSDIFAIRPGTDAEPIPLATTDFEELSPTLSPDGRWLAYKSNETGRGEIYVIPFQNGDRTRWSVSPDGGTEPVWSHGGGQLYYRDGRGNLVATEVQTTPTFSVGRSTVLFDARGYEMSGLHPSYAVAHDDQRFLMIRDVGAPAPAELIVVENWLQELEVANGKR